MKKIELSETEAMALLIMLNECSGVYWKRYCRDKTDSSHKPLEMVWAIMEKLTT